MIIIIISLYADDIILYLDHFDVSVSSIIKELIILVAYQNIVTCSQTQDTDRLESNRRVYCIDVNEQRKQGINGRDRVFNLNGDDPDEDILCYQV